MNKMLISHLDAVAWHLEQGHENGAIGREALAEFLRHVAKELEMSQVKLLFNDTSRGALMVMIERSRHMSVEGWTAEHDDEHQEGQLVHASIAYALTEDTDDPMKETVALEYWPWDWEFWKPSGRITNLVKAGALNLCRN